MKEFTGSHFSQNSLPFSNRIGCSEGSEVYPDEYCDDFLSLTTVGMTGAGKCIALSKPHHQIQLPGKLRSINTATDTAIACHRILYNWPYLHTFLGRMAGIHVSN